MEILIALLVIGFVIYLACGFDGDDHLAKVKENDDREMREMRAEREVRRAEELKKKKELEVWIEEHNVRFSLLKDEVHTYKGEEVKLIKGEYEIYYLDRMKGPVVSSVKGTLPFLLDISFLLNGSCPLKCLDYLIGEWEACVDRAQSLAADIAKEKYDKQRDIARDLIGNIPHCPNRFALAMKEAENFM